ncbi:LysR family positive regulator for ilvC [Kribbella aluminosa]|uniref:LysR family positive regulator for ilvC n=1 Tax=Kribbella aluminosa TaxID=416017 RepID=A0ABS4UDR6_9ACTN|nr:HTH-type transcriptional activator IlvY [Kribbella aluminosa]MBP2349763.1 LysR family positive regulator for ilvC [Kribbella aluminosa]
MEQRELELFLHLGRTLNYGRTSLECHVSAATLTRTIQRLEVRVGARLLDRGPRGVMLTAEGRRFTAYAEKALELWADYRAASEEPTGLAGELRIFATVTACQTLLPDLLRPLRDEHPQIRLDIRTGDAAAALARLDEGEVDAAVAGIPKRLPQTLVTRTVAVTDLVLVRATNNPPANRPDGPSAKPAAGLPATPPGLPSDGPYVVPARGLVREAAFRWFRRTGVRPTIAAEPDGHEALLALVALGCGVGVVPRLVLDSSVVRDQLEELPADLEPLTIGLCARRADLHRPLVAALWALRP